jgi:hypothetical protein
VGFAALRAGKVPLIHKYFHALGTFGNIKLQFKERIFLVISFVLALNRHTVHYRTIYFFVIINLAHNVFSFRTDAMAKISIRRYAQSIVRRGNKQIFSDGGLLDGKLE